MANICELTLSIVDNGAETLIKDYALMLNREKFNVVIVVLYRSPDTANDKLLREAGIKIIPIFKTAYNKPPLKQIRRMNYWWIIPYKLNKILRKENIDVLHVHMSLMHYVVKLSRELKNIRLFYTCHSKPERYLSPSKRRNEYKAAKKLIQENDLRIIALHEEMKNEIDQILEINSTVVIKNGIDFKRYSETTDNKDEIRNEIGIATDKFVLGHVGRFDEIKNHKFLVEVFHEVHKRNPKAFLLMIGAGILKTKIEDSLHQMGLDGHYLILSHRSDVPKLLKAMDVFVFPSLIEGLGIALIEAQVAGLKCVASDTIPKEAFKTEFAIPLSLKKKPSEWCDIILDSTIKNIPYGNLEDYDMNKEIRKLEKLYLGEFNE